MSSGTTRASSAPGRRRRTRAAMLTRSPSCASMRSSIRWRRPCVRFWRACRRRAPGDGEARRSGGYRATDDSASAPTAWRWQAAAEAARRLGYEPYVDAKALVGDTTTAAHHWFRQVRGRIEGPDRARIAGRRDDRSWCAARVAVAAIRSSRWRSSSPIAGASVVVLSAGTRRHRWAYRRRWGVRRRRDARASEGDRPR